MSEVLEAIFDGRRVGRISYTRDRLHFEYGDAWREDRASFPLSLSMRVTRREHDDAVVRPFISEELNMRFCPNW
jgi:HipA-like protein